MIVVSHMWLFQVEPSASQWTHISNAPEPQVPEAAVLDSTDVEHSQHGRKFWTALLWHLLFKLSSWNNEPTQTPGNPRMWEPLSQGTIAKQVSSSLLPIRTEVGVFPLTEYKHSLRLSEHQPIRFSPESNRNMFPLSQGGPSMTTFPFLMPFTVAVIEIVLSTEHFCISCCADHFTFRLLLNLHNSPKR